MLDQMLDLPEACYWEEPQVGPQQGPERGSKQEAQQPAPHQQVCNSHRLHLLHQYCTQFLPHMALLHSKHSYRSESCIKQY